MSIAQKPETTTNCTTDDTIKCAMLLFTISKLESNRATSSLRGIRCSSCNQPALYKYIYFQHSNKVLQAKIKPAVEVSE